MTITPTTRNRTSALFVTILLLFLVSGACGLIYQVVWTRKFVLLFGAASYAVSTVLSIFFLGLGLGSLWGGRLADSLKRPLLLYGCFEIAIGIWALLFIFFIDAAEQAIVPLLATVGSSRAAAILLRALLAAAFLALPVTLMGATLPLLARYVTKDMAFRGFRIGTLYSINTAGAVAGCAAGGFVLLPALGYTKATAVAAILNFAVGVIAIALDRKPRHEPKAEPLVEDAHEGSSTLTSPDSTRYLGPVMVAFGISGFCALALEVLWTRLLAIVFLGTTYAFTTMLTAMLCGIALGSATVAWVVDRRRDPVAAFGFVQMLTGVACLLMLAAFPWLPEKLAEYQLATDYEWSGLVARKFVLSFAVLFLPTFLFGMSFPLALRATPTASRDLGRIVGRLYCANTLGGVIGALLGGFVLIPLLGVHNGILALSLMLGISGLVLLAISPNLPVPRKAIAAAPAIALFVFSMSILPNDVSLHINRWFIPDDHEMIHHSEGVEGTIVVTAPIEDTGGAGRYLWINAVQATASIDKGVKMNRFQGVLPMLFDREPREALFMCLGSGVTAGTLALSPIESITAVEISRDVLRAVPYFGADNFDVLENSRIRTVIDDGRNFLLTSADRYDLITFEPMPLALAGVAAFYTREYYQLCFDRLAERGLVSQWVPLHSLNLEIVRSMVRTFTDVFPHYSAWFINADLFLIGSDQPLFIDYEAIQKRLAENETLRKGLAEVYLPDAYELLASFLMGQEALDAFAEGAPVMIDDKPWAEFVAPKLIYENHVAESVEAIIPFAQSPVHLLANRQNLSPDILAAIERRHLAHVSDLRALVGFYGADFGSRPDVAFRESLNIDPQDWNARYYLSEILFHRGSLNVRWQNREEAEAELFEAHAMAPQRPDVLLALVDAFDQWGEPAAASAYYDLYLEAGGRAVRRFLVREDALLPIQR